MPRQEHSLSFLFQSWFANCREGRQEQSNSLLVSQNKICFNTALLVLVR